MRASWATVSRDFAFRSSGVSEGKTRWNWDPGPSSLFFLRCYRKPTINVHIKSLLKKLGEAGELIETVRGVGYRFHESRLVGT